MFLRKTQQSQNQNEVSALMNEKRQIKKNTLLSDSRFSLENMAESYKFSVKRKASQNPPALRGVETIADVLSQRSHVGTE